MATKITPQLKPAQQRIIVDLAKQEDVTPQQLVDSMVDHFQAKKFNARIDQARQDIRDGNGVPHKKVMRKLKTKIEEKITAQ